MDCDAETRQEQTYEVTMIWTFGEIKTMLMCGIKTMKILKEPRFQLPNTSQKERIKAFAGVWERIVFSRRDGML